MNTEENLQLALSLADERINSLEASYRNLRVKHINMLEVLSAVQPAVRRAAAEGITLQIGSRTHPRYGLYPEKTVLDNGKVADDLNQMLKENNWT